MMRGRAVSFVAAGGVLCLASGFLPWWIVRVRVATQRDAHYDTYGASAWRISTRWTEALLVGTAAAAVWSAWWLVRRHTPVVVHLAVLAAAILAVFLTVDQRRAAQPWPPPGMQTIQKSTVVLGSDRLPGTEEYARDWIKRDQLRTFHGTGLTVDVGWGYWVGLTGMTLVGLSMVGALVDHGRTVGPPRDA
jgi:hypothetical protein